MGFKFASLGSGSQGNGLLVSSSKTSLLVDCGFSTVETERRLHRLSVTPESVDAILVTHEHGDHVGGVAGLAKKYSIPIFCTPGTLIGSPSLEGLDHIVNINSYSAFVIQDLVIQPFPVPHDAREPSQFTVTYGKEKLGVLTDCGAITPHMKEQLSGCSALFIEFNHDAEMLKRSHYPSSLKARITGGYGHINNSEAINLLECVKGPELRYVVAAHLSKENNDPQLVRSMISRSLGWCEEQVDIATQECGQDWRVLDDSE